MAEISDELLKNLVETCKKKRLERTASELTKDREGRVYVNRSISMDRIKYIGFDMDHTLVVYKSPEYDILAYDLTVDRLIATGYPKSIKDIKYDPSFAIRGLFFDRKYGNLLKLDSFGNILSCCHGFSILSP
jgi:5'-nucleotidase